jgi:hypothetical protein
MASLEGFEPTTSCLEDSADDFHPFRLNLRSESEANHPVGSLSHKTPLDHIIIQRFQKMQIMRCLCDIQNWGVI